MTKKLMCKIFGCKWKKFKLEKYIRPIKTDMKIIFCLRCGESK